MAIRRRLEQQRARIRVRGGYNPSCVVVRAGLPISLIFRREETAACSERVIFPDLGKSEMLPPFEEVTVELPAIEPGEHEFTCQLGVLKGRLIARADGGRRRAILLGRP